MFSVSPSVNDAGACHSALRVINRCTAKSVGARAGTGGGADGSSAGAGGPSASACGNSRVEAGAGACGASGGCEPVCGELGSKGAPAVGLGPDATVGRDVKDAGASAALCDEPQAETMSVTSAIGTSAMIRVWRIIAGTSRRDNRLPGRGSRPDHATVSALAPLAMSSRLPVLD
jgi:hypothetical protein